jgi:hypothetical protein
MSRRIRAPYHTNYEQAREWGASSGKFGRSGLKPGVEIAQGCFGPVYEGAAMAIEEIWTIVTGLSLGIGLAAACGFRVFVPLLALSIGAHAGLISLGESFAWVGSYPAMIALGTASVLEIVAYKAPWLDHALDTVASPAAVVAGTLVAGSQLGVTGMDPLLTWSLALIAGGGAAGLVQATSVVTRAASTVATAGFLNPFISAGQSVLSVIVSVMAILAPIVAVVVLVVFVAGLAVVLLRVRARRAGPATA